MLSGRHDAGVMTWIRCEIWITPMVFGNKQVVCRAMPQTQSVECVRSSKISSSTSGNRKSTWMIPFRKLACTPSYAPATSDDPHAFHLSANCSFLTFLVNVKTNNFVLETSIWLLKSIKIPYFSETTRFTVDENHPLCSSRSRLRLARRRLKGTGQPRWRAPWCEPLDVPWQWWKMGRSTHWELFFRILF